MRTFYHPVATIARLLPNRNTVERKPVPTRPQGRVCAEKPRKRGSRQGATARFTGLLRVDPPFRAGRVLPSRLSLNGIGPNNPLTRLHRRQWWTTRETHPP